MSEVQKKQTNLREKLAELLDFRKMRDRLSGLGLYIGKDRTNTDENLLVRGGANVDDLQLAEISAAVGGTAVDVFVYDTSRDSDGGKWRERTQHTSWYNEELNTATRGARREFPAVAVIVAESGNIKKLKIYDGDDPDLPLWMSFEANGVGSALGRSSISAILGISSIYMLNGLLCVKGLGTTGGNIETLCQISFIDDVFWQWHKYGFGDPSISERNEAHSVTSQEYRGRTDEPINTHSYNDVAMTVLPNAPIDENTGLPVPTIAVATDGGVSVIKDDGTVVDLNVFSRPYSSVYLSGNMVWAVENPETDYDLLRYFEIPSNDIATASSYGPNSSPALFPANTRGNVFDSFNYGSPIGITKLDHTGSVSSMVAYISSKYNTGWMPGDIKLATLSDSVVENVGVNSDELVNNGDFSNGTTGWTGLSGGVLSIDNERLKIEETTNAVDAYAVNSSVIPTVVGKKYIITWQFIKGTNTGFSVRFGNSGDQTYDYKSNIVGEYTDDGYYSFEFIATATELNLSFIVNEASTYGFVDNISVRATTELITNGDFSTDVTATDGQTSGGWTSNKASLSVEGGRLKIVDAGSSASAYQAINTIVGQKYTLSLSGQFNDGSDGNIQVRDASFAGTMLNSIDPIGLHETPAEFSLTFVAESSTSVVRLTPASTSSFTATFDNVSVRPAEEDRSVNDNGLQIIGEINKTPVAPGADLVAYSVEAESANGLVQPYNSDLDFGPDDDFSYSCWIYTDSSKTYSGKTYIFERSSLGDPDSRRIELRIASATKLELYLNGVNDIIPGARNIVVSADSWSKIDICRQEGVLYVYVNGELKTSGPHNYDMSDNQAKLVVCNRAYYSSLLAGCPAPVALFRISATAPTDAQIAKIYRDEKALFTDGAQSTLYGTSDAVTALSYDQKTELLHVGTASGRSDFSGLSRVHQTNSPVTTCIDAEDGLIAEN